MRHSAAAAVAKAANSDASFRPSFGNAHAVMAALQLLPMLQTVMRHFVLVLQAPMLCCSATAAAPNAAHNDACAKPCILRLPVASGCQLTSFIISISRQAQTIGSASKDHWKGRTLAIKHRLITRHIWHTKSPKSPPFREGLSSAPPAYVC